MCLLWLQLQCSSSIGRQAVPCALDFSARIRIALFPRRIHACVVCSCLAANLNLPDAPHDGRLACHVRKFVSGGVLLDSSPLFLLVGKNDTLWFRLLLVIGVFAFVSPQGAHQYNPIMPGVNLLHLAIVPQRVSVCSLGSCFCFLSFRPPRSGRSL